MQAALAHSGHADIADVKAALHIKTDATDVFEALRADFALLSPPSATKSCFMRGSMAMSIGCMMLSTLCGCFWPCGSYFSTRPGSGCGGA
jgi:hypothetical protein